MHGARYYVHFIDAYSKYTWIYFLHSRSELQSVFMHFINMVELQLGTKLKTFQSDNALEYKGLTKSLQAQGVIHRFSCPHIHQQNGSAERKHRHIVEMGLTLLAEASLPLTFWGEAFTTVVQLINSLPTPLLNNFSPTEVLFGKKPPYQSFKVFGCLCFPFTRHSYKAYQLCFFS